MKSSLLLILTFAFASCTTVRRPIARHQPAAPAVSYPQPEPAPVEPALPETSAPIIPIAPQPTPSTVLTRTPRPIPSTSAAATHRYVPTAPSYSYGRADERDDVRRQADDLSWELGRLRRNAQDYDSDEFRRRLRRLESDADSLASSADDAGVDASTAEDLSHNLRKIRRTIDFEPSSYYRNRNYGIDRSLKNYGNALEDYSNNIDE